MPQQEVNINPATESGTALATLLNAAFAARDSMNSGAARPSYVAAGMLWMQTGGATWPVYFFDGTNDVLLYTIDPTAHSAVAPISAGGTGATTASAARTALGLGALATLSAVGTAQITNASVVTASIADGAVTRAKMASDTGNKGKYLVYDPVTGAVNVAAGTIDPTKVVQSLAANGQTEGTLGAVMMQDGNVRAWGINTNLANGDVTNQATYFPQRLSKLTALSAPIAKVYSGYYCHFILTTDGKVYAWGYNVDGNLGLGDNTNRSSPVQVAALAGVTITDIFLPKAPIASAHTFTIFRDNAGNLYACGINTGGQLGQGNTASLNTPTQVKGVGGAGFLANIVGVSISDGNNGHVLAYDSGGVGYVWGNNPSGNFGDGTSGTTSTTPKLITSVSNIAEVLASGEFTSSFYELTSYLRTASGQVWSCGKNDAGQLGDGSTVDKSAWQLVWNASIEQASSMTSNGGFSSSFGILTATGKPYVCGYNGSGQLGQGNTVSLSTLTQMGALAGATKFRYYGTGGATSPDAFGLLLIGGLLYHVGYGAFSPRGDGTTTAALTTAGQVQMPMDFLTSGETVTDFQAYGHRTSGTTLYALTSAGRLMVWGAPFLQYTGTRIGSTSQSSFTILPAIFA